MLSSPVTYIYLLAFALMLVVTTVQTMFTPRHPAWRHLVLLFSSFTLWTLMDLLSNLASTAAGVERLAKIGAPIWSVAPVLLLLAVIRYTGWPGWARSKAFAWILALPALGCIYLVEADLLYVRYYPASANGSYFHSQPSGWLVPVNVFQLTYLGAAVLLLLLSARRHSAQALKQGARYTLRVIAPTAVLAASANGGLALFGVHLPLLASPLFAVMALSVTVLMLRRGYFAPVREIERARDQALADLSRRDDVLVALPIGVAILSDDSSELLYANQHFVGLACVIRGEQRRIDARLGSQLTPLMRGGGIRNSELTFERDGTRLYLLASAQPVDYAGRQAWLLTLRDVTSQHQIEQQLEQQRQQLHQAQKLETIGRLSAGIAHDFNNQLAVIMGHATLLEQELPEGSTQREDLGEIQRASERARVLIRQLLSTSRRPSGEAQVFDATTMITGLRRLLARMLGPDVDVHLKQPDVPCFVRMERVQLEQVLMTLSANARDAMPHGGRLEITVRCQSDGPDSQRKVAIEVHDTGPGMSAEVQAHIFEPFYSTKGDRGTGLGLSMSQGMMQRAGGRIEVHSRPGAGSTFVILLPWIAPPVHASVEPHSLHNQPVREPLRGLTALLVDDEAGVRRSLARLLGQVGLEVLEADSGARAIELFGQNHERIHLLITDISMPAMDGFELARHLRQQRPDLPLLYISGHLAGTTPVLPESAAFITKPFQLDELILRVLDLVPPVITPTLKRRVLVVDDDPALLRLIVRTIERPGVQVMTAEGRAAAESVLQDFAIDCVLSDLQLADGSGNEVLDAAQRLRPNAIRVLMTGAADSAAMTLDEGVRLVPKPFEPGDLLRALSIDSDNKDDGAARRRLTPTTVQIH